MDSNILQKAKETIHETSLPGVLVIERPTFPDGRGFFRETFRLNELEAILGREFKVTQQNHSRNETKGTLRGIHIAPWDKFVYCVRGIVQQVVVDLREDSLTFGKHEVFIIGDEKKAKIFVPAGCGNAFVILSDIADYIYDTNGYWYPNSEKSVIWNDPDLNIKWELEGEPNLSDKDKTASRLRDLFSHKFNK